MLAAPDFRQYKLNSLSDFELFIRYDAPRYAEFTGMLNARLDTLPVGGTLLVSECTSLPKQYNLIVKWFCWRAFISHHVKPDKKDSRAVRFDMLPDYSGIRKSYANNRL